MAGRIVKIQPDGVCRVPSSRVVRDGMASESLNMVSELGESVPVLPAAEVEGVEGIPGNWGQNNGELVFVHVQPTYEHYIFLLGGALGVHLDGWHPFMELGDGESLNGIVGVGNTLVVSTSEATHYVLWKEGSYRDLGTELPKPAVQFIGGERERRGVFSTDEVGDAKSKDNNIWLDLPNITSEQQTSSYSKAEVAEHGFFFCGSDTYDYDADRAEETDNARIQAIWNAYANAVAYASAFNRLEYVNGRAFYQPYLFRYALRLYDGTYAKQSVPVLVGGGVTWPQFLGDTRLDGSYGEGHNTGDGHYGFAMVPMFSVRVLMGEAVSEDWGDIVTAVDIFCSSPINMYDPGDATISKMGDPLFVTDIEDAFHHDPNDDHFISPNEGNRCIAVQRYGMSDDQVEAKLLNYNVFYRIGSFLIDNSGFSLDEDYDPAQEFTANQEDLVAGIQLKKPDADTLVTHTSTASSDWDDYEADHTLHGNAQKVMNQRLAIWDIDKTLGTGLNVLNGQSTTAAEFISYPSLSECAPSETTAYVYRFCWVIDDNGEERFVWGRTDYAGDGDNPELVFAPFRDTAGHYLKDDLGFIAADPVVCVPYGWLAYPDAKCRRVLFQRMEIASFTSGGDIATVGTWGSVMSLPMKEHPFLNCAYAWLGFANALEGAAATAEDAERFGELYEDRTVRDTNTIMLSGAANPFTFPAAGRYTFDYAVVSCATANMPLSTGQFGQFPLYVFTKGGIWAMAMNTDGTFASSSPFSRDVAVSDRGVCEIDQGIIFIADKAVLAIQGGQITDISQVMTGRHDPLPDTAASVLEACGYGKEGVTVGDLSDAWGDGTPFMDFMMGASAGYDYVGDRMIFLNTDYRWQWTWMRKTATWHRMMLSQGDYGYEGNISDGIYVKSLVNSWPGLMANLRGFDNSIGAAVHAVVEMTSQLDRTRDETLSSTGLYVSRPLTLDNPDVFKSIMDLRIRGDLRRGNAKHLLLSSNNGHDWVLRRSLRGPSFRFHRLVLVTRMTTAERLSYVELVADDRLAKRLR